MSKKPVARYWDADEIQFLPKRLYKSVFGDDYNDNWRLRFSDLSESEKEALTPILKTNKIQTIYRIPEVNEPNGVHTADLLINGTRVEIKNISSANSVKDQVGKATKQIGTDGSLIINATHSQLSETELEGVLFKRMAEKHLVSATVVKNQIAIVYKSKTDLHASPNPGIDYRSVYIGIVSKNNEFVNAIKPTKSYPRTSSRIYWEERSIRRTLEAEYHGLSYLRQTYNVYSEASREITRQVQDIYARYYKDKGFDVEALRELVPQGDIMRLRKQIRELGLNVDLPDNYNARINRLELLNFQIQVEMNRASRKIDKLMGKSLAETYKNSYYRTTYDTSKGIGEISNFSRLNTKGVRKVLSEKNYGKNFSERIWGRSQKLGNELKEIVGKAIATGQSHAKTSRLIRERFNVSKSSADRLIRTETNYYENQAELDSYKEMGIERYQFIATIDTKTSEICQHLDKKVFKVKDATPGVNMPPMHPNCRSTITAFLGEEYEADTRIARNLRTNTSEYIENMSYKEWLKQFSNLDADIFEDWAE